MHSFDGAEVETLLSHFGEEEKLHGAVVPPIFQNSLFAFESVDAFVAAGSAPPGKAPYVYSRVSNPTIAVAEAKLAKLEGTEACRVFGSGMAAITSAIMACVESGAHVVAVDTCYGPTRQLLADYLPRFGITATFVDGVDPQEFFDAIRPETKLVYLESPSSLVFRLQDLATITAYCRERGILTAIDNTYATPLYQQPAALGVDIVLHTASKYLGGHSDITGGVLCGSTEFVKRITKDELSLFGSVIAPFPAWLMIRGMRTLAIRLKRHEETGNTIARWLETHPAVEQVHHLGLDSFPQKELFRKQMKGSGGLFSFVPKNQDQAAVVKFIEALDIFQLGVSWGGFESLAVPLHVHPMYLKEKTWMIRLFTGLESPVDLMKDLERAFEVSGL
jgi:cystathionine beta-lyase